MNKLKILLADDHVSFRNVLASFLRAQPGVELVGEAIDGDDAIDQTNRLQPDLVLMDVHMPRTSGVEATKAIKALNPQTKVVMMSTDSSESYQRSACQIADGYVPKTTIKVDLSFILGSMVSIEQTHAVVA